MDFQKNRPLVFGLAFVLISFVGIILYVGINMGPGTYGYVGRYQSDHSKEFVRRAVDDFFKRHPETRLPDKLSAYATRISFGSDSLNRSNALNADSVNFSFFLEDKNWIIWSSFSGIHHDWQKSQCELLLVGFANLGSRWHSEMRFERDINEKERESLSTVFENEILKNLDSLSFVKLE